MAEYSIRKNGRDNLASFDVDTAASRRVRKAMRSRRFDVVEQAVAQTSEINELSHLVEAIGDWRGDAAFALELFASSTRPEIRVASLIHAAKHAWDFSPWTRGSTDLAEFDRRIHTVRDALAEVTRDPALRGLPVPWLTWCVAAVGPETESEKIGEFVVKRCGGYLAAGAVAVLSRSSYWHGSEEEARQLALRFTEASDPVTGAGVLAEMHGQFSGGRVSGDYWERPHVREDVMRAHELVRSHALSGPSGMRCMQNLSYCLWKIGEHAAALPLLDQFKGAAAFVPWNTLPYGLEVLFGNYRSARKQCRRNR